MGENTGLGQESKEQDKAIQEKREERRKRRKRSQVAAYLTLVCFVILFAGLIVVTVTMIGKQAKEKDSANASVSDNIGNLIETEETLVKPEPSDIVQEQTPEEKLDEIINAAIEVMPIEDKVAGLFIVTPESITGVGTAVQAGDGTKEALNKWAVGGLIYFKKKDRKSVV